MEEGAEDSSLGLSAPPGSTSLVGPPLDAPPETGPKETEEEEEEEEVVVEGGEEQGPLGCLGLAAASCCVCVELEQIHRCARSEKICILPIIACLLSLALCTAGLKWVFVDKIFEYEPPTHLDPKRIGQDPVVIDADPTLGLPVSASRSTSPTALPPATSTTANPGQPEVFVEGESTAGPFGPAPPKVTPTSALTSHTGPNIWPIPKTTPEPGRNGTPSQHPSLESNNIITKTSATSTTPAAKTSSHVTRCSEKEKGYCVNGGECFTLEVTPKSIKRLCRCPNEFTGDRCQNYVMASFYKHHGIEFMAEEMYQKRVLTITGICIALLVVGIMCVVAYCKTKKQRQKLHERLRQSVRERNALANGQPCPRPGQQCPRPGQPPLQSPPHSLQLVNQYALKNAAPPQHVIEKETETSFSTGHHTPSTQPSTVSTHPSNHCWSNGKTTGAVSDSRMATVILSTQGSRNGTPSHRGRLNATGGTGDLKSHLTNLRELTESYKDSPYSERYVSTMTTPTHLSPVKLLSPATPSSPPSEMSAPLSSLATSVPSMATSPSGADEHPLLFHEKPDASRAQGANRLRQHRHSAHYNHGLDTASPPPSPLHIAEEDRYESMQEREGTPASTPAPASTSTPHSPSERTEASETCPAARQDAGSGGGSESSSSESETEDEPVNEDTPFLSIQNPGAVSTAILALDVRDSSRTNPALRLSPQDDLQTRLASVMANQDPIAV
ncbi:pro-neuregulin-1, membrane-bound isoform isoform X3 [Brachyhypopomus gauderio]|uniref:pro-neuregulin-1, membrane-bound isoform isoform X3 n=1 Tax=Brachyhypopomus gauderio TaxID=698409 RepID=UPI00404331EF